MKRYYYTNKKDLNSLVAKINRTQSKAGLFVNISVKPYNGNKNYSYVVIVG